ncbi:MAG: YncE family protein, partial [Bryobacteraceae bacterium]
QAPSGDVVVHLPVAVLPRHFCFKADGGQLFLTGAGADVVVIVYPYRSEVAETVLAGRAPAAMAVSTNPEYLFVASPETGDVNILEIETRYLVAVAQVGESVNAVAVTPDNQFALALNERAGTLAVIRVPASVSRRRRLAPLFTVVPVGPRPTSLAIARL